VTRALKHDIPGIDWRVGIEDVRAKGWDSLFADAETSAAEAAARPLVVEIGFGRGEFVMDLAARSPGVRFVAVELAMKRVLKMARRLARTELRNVRLVQARGELVVEELLAPGSVSAFWINFPDPWPKKRHARRRLVQPGLVRLLATRLAPGGLLHVATDDAAYAEEIDAALSGEPLLENALAPARSLPDVEGRLQTAYEREWRAEGRRLHFFTYRRIPGTFGAA
jgi:tRNA (guanine-N7-)-methyltransferase